MTLASLTLPGDGGTVMFYLPAKPTIEDAFRVITDLENSGTEARKIAYVKTVLSGEIKGFAEALKAPQSSNDNPLSLRISMQNPSSDISNAPHGTTYSCAAKAFIIITVALSALTFFSTMFYYNRP